VKIGTNHIEKTALRFCAFINWIFKGITLKNIARKSLYSFVSFLLLTIGTAQAGNKMTNIKQLLDTYETALNASDIKTIMTLYSDSAIFMPQHAEAQIGLENIENSYNHVFNAINLNVEFTTHEIEELGDTAWARTSSAGKTTILANGAIIDEGNNELFVFKKDNGSWKIHRYIFSTNTSQK
jgi:uncharacterized protein (TIGR02246 family)